MFFARLGYRQNSATLNSIIILSVNVQHRDRRRLAMSNNGSSASRLIGNLLVFNTTTRSDVHAKSRRLKNSNGPILILSCIKEIKKLNRNEKKEFRVVVVVVIERTFCSLTVGLCSRTQLSRLSPSVVDSSRSTPTDGFGFTTLIHPWRSHIQVLTEVGVP